LFPPSLTHFQSTTSVVYGPFDAHRPSRYEHWERIARPTMTTTTIDAFCSFMATYLASIAANDHLYSFFLFLGEILQCGDKKNSLRSVPRIFWKKICNVRHILRKKSQK
jgi:hypothetical protein